MSCPFAALGLAPSATEAEVKAAWREIAMRLHPDHGGTTDEFAAALADYREALHHIATKPCPTCNGTGTHYVTSGWTSMPLPCPTCGGHQ